MAMNTVGLLPESSYTKFDVKFHTIVTDQEGNERILLQSTKWYAVEDAKRANKRGDSATIYSWNSNEKRYIVDESAMSDLEKRSKKSEVTVNREAEAKFGNLMLAAKAAKSAVLKSDLKQEHIDFLQEAINDAQSIIDSI